MSTPRNQRPGCFLTVFPGLLLLVLAVSALAAPEEVGRAVYDMVPRQVQVAVGPDHVWASLRATVKPADLGIQSWQRWDQDRDGSLSAVERDVLAEELRDRETEFLSLLVDGHPVPLSSARWRWQGEPGRSQPLAAAAVLRIEARLELALAAGEHHFVLYDRPASTAGIVPIRFSLAQGMVLGEVVGVRAEKRSPRRLEAVVSHLSPTVWGTFERLAAP